MSSLYSSWVTCAVVRLRWVARSDGATSITCEKGVPDHQFAAV